jgi:hypothetical protein
MGLCATCEHAQVIVSSKGSSFLLCGLAKVDHRFSKYPVLPVIECHGFQKKTKRNDDKNS